MAAIAGLTSKNPWIRHYYPNHLGLGEKKREARDKKLNEMNNESQIAIS